VSIVEDVTGEPRKTPAQATWPREAALAAFVLAVSTLIALTLRPRVAATNLAMVYLVGVVIVAMHCGRRISVAISLLSMAAFDFFCVPPYLTLRVSDYEYLITFAGMLAAALVISTQTARIRTQAAEAIAREARTETLYRFSRRLAGQASVFELTRVAAEYAEEVLGGHVVIFLPQDGHIDFRRRSSDRLLVATAEQTVAQWAFEHGERAGCGTQITPGAAALYLPLKGVKETVGIMGVLTNGGGPMTSQQLQLLDVLASQTAMAIERTRSQHAAEAARMQMETEQMRSSLLSAVSHDLRTPLSSITGAASTLRSQGDKLEAETRQDLLESIADEAERLSRLVSNLLDMTRLESGVELRRDFYPLEEIVGAALQRMERQLERRPVTTSLPDSIPLVYADDVLLGQLVINLLENAIKYSPKGSPIEVAAQAREDALILEVRDRGPGFTPDETTRIFAKFYRGKADGARGVGLGLAICRAITEAHEGTIEALNRPGGGAIFRIRLPVRKLP
jgi:two-component system, OmpR family, sensor histidine kinase KdpD